jgi:cellulose synthase/poly-beta-1,6-N-acetylglucosamine synthase-like glycosyltransferase
MSAWVLAFAIAGMPVLLASLYLLACTLLWQRPPEAPRRPGRLRFAVIVPAHNEERGIGATLKSLRAMGYPAQRWRLLVVADNCTDGTAGVAGRHGAEVLQRTDALSRGKGYALQFAFQSLLAEPPGQWDAAVVVDADTLVSPNLLDALACRIEAGEEAVQAAYLVRTQGGGLAAITEVAFTAFHLVRSAARERFGLSCGLRGNGMAFSRRLLAEVPHDAFSRAEDLEYGIRIGLAGIRVAFAAEALVRGDMPNHESDAARQRERWIGGRIELARRFVPRLLAQALWLRSPMLADLAFDLMVPPLSVLVTTAALGIAGCAALALARQPVTVALMIWSVASAALALHVAHAAQLSGRAGAFLGATVALPRYTLGRALIAFRALGPSAGAWVRTRREGEMK